MKQKERIVRVTELAVLIAVLLLLEVTGLGMIRTFGLEMTIMQVPVIIGAILLGQNNGAILGACFGLISFWECLSGKSSFGAALLAINPFYTFLLCVPTRTLMGWLCGLIFRVADNKLSNTKVSIVPYITASLSGALLNTVLFMGTLCVCFYNTPFIQGFADTMHADNVLIFIVLFVGIQGLIEAGVCAALGTAISKAVRYALNRNK